MRAHVFPQLLFRSGYRLFIEKPIRCSFHILRQDRNALIKLLRLAAGGKGILYDPILQRLKADDTQPSSDMEKLQCIPQHQLQLTQLIIHGNTNCLKHLFCRVSLSTFAGSADLMTSTKAKVVSIGFTSLAFSIFLAICFAKLSSPN